MILKSNYFDILVILLVIKSVRRLLGPVIIIQLHLEYCCIVAYLLPHLTRCYNVIFFVLFIIRPQSTSLLPSLASVIHKMTKIMYKTDFCNKPWLMKCLFFTKQWNDDFTIPIDVPLTLFVWVTHLNIGG